MAQNAGSGAVRKKVTTQGSLEFLPSEDAGKHRKSSKSRQSDSFLDKSDTSRPNSGRLSADGRRAPPIGRETSDLYRRTPTPTKNVSLKARRRENTDEKFGDYCWDEQSEIDRKYDKYQNRDDRNKQKSHKKYSNSSSGDYSIDRNKNTSVDKLGKEYSHENAKYRASKAKMSASDEESIVSGMGKSSLYDQSSSTMYTESTSSMGSSGTSYGTTSSSSMATTLKDLEKGSTSTLGALRSDYGASNIDARGSMAGSQFDANRGSRSTIMGSEFEGHVSRADPQSLESAVMEGYMEDTRRNTNRNSNKPEETPEIVDLDNSGEFDTDLEDGEEEEEESSEEEPIKAPNELFMEFLECVMKEEWKDAQKLCTMILMYEPEHAEANTFKSVIEEKIKLEEELAAMSSDSEEGEIDDGEEDDSDDSDDSDSDEEDSDEENEENQETQETVEK